MERPKELELLKEWIDELVSSYDDGMKDKRTAYGYLVQLMQTLHHIGLPLDPVDGLFIMKTNRNEPNVLHSAIADALSMTQIRQVHLLIDRAYEMIRNEDNVYPESFIMHYSTRLYENAVITSHTGESIPDEELLIRPMVAQIVEGEPKTYDKQTALDIAFETKLACSQLTLQNFAKAGISGFILDARGFVAIDEEHIPKECEQFLAFLHENLGPMGGRARHRPKGEDAEPYIEEEIAKIMEEDEGKRFMPTAFQRHFENEAEIDPDSDENDDEVVRW